MLQPSVASCLTLVAAALVLSSLGVLHGSVCLLSLFSIPHLPLLPPWQVALGLEAVLAGTPATICKTKVCVCFLLVLVCWMDGVRIILVRCHPARFLHTGCFPPSTTRVIGHTHSAEKAGREHTGCFQCTVIMHSKSSNGC